MEEANRICACSMCRFFLVRAHGPESKKDEPRSGAGTSQQPVEEASRIGGPPHSYREACVQNLHLSPVKMNSKGVRSSFLHVSHIPPSSHAPFCPITLQALSKLCPTRVFEVPSCMFRIFRQPVMPHSAQALSKLCLSPPISVQASHQTMSGIQVLATFGGL